MTSKGPSLSYLMILILVLNILQCVTAEIFCTHQRHVDPENVVALAAISTEVSEQLSD